MGLVTTYLRAVESSRDDCIISDPFAEPLTKKYKLKIQESMRGLERKSQLHFRPEDFIAFRTRYLDEALNHRNSKILQIVILGAGMDARAYRLESLRGCHVFEVDQAGAVFSHKLVVFNELKAPLVADKVDYIVSDLAENGLEEKLVEHGFNPNLPTFWAMEGLIPYIEQSGVVELLRVVDSLSALGSELWVDIPGQCVSDTDEWGKRAMKYGEDDPLKGVFSQILWRLEVQVSLGTVGEHFGRPWVPMLSPKSKHEVPFFCVIGRKPNSA
ncbi:putative S-adenosyl-L-methionine-dependent methyltransferase [Phytophthora citrophthora]|uniref:S-adenosyl-L-methionine-dependent methyltransferase n=1 Tax=Phytophthora citrophthora TaxID=4793 RepID=A0AAD9GUS4_9STRA|nr:putative S-adenosyl-L-methionine-dependent methyltransferase [Phytophthora citrophthora]